MECSKTASVAGAERAKCEFKVWLGGGGGQSRRTVLALARV